MTGGPSSTPRGEHAGTPGAHWDTELVRVETVIADDAPDPQPNRATRRALARAAHRTPIRAYPDEVREDAEALIGELLAEPKEPTP
jgi:hypothetical protein